MKEVELHWWQKPRWPQPKDAAWHARQARECLAQGNRFAFEFHVACVAKTDADQADVLRREAAGVFADEPAADGLPVREDLP